MDIAIILYSATKFTCMKSRTRSHSLERMSVGLDPRWRSDSCQLLSTGCHGAPVYSTTWCKFICAARVDKDVGCVSIGKGRTPLAEILVERWCEVEHFSHGCNLARIPTSHGLVERHGASEHGNHVCNLTRIPTSHGLVECWYLVEHGIHGCNLARIPTSHGLVEHWCSVEHAIHVCNLTSRRLRRRRSAGAWFCPICSRLPVEELPPVCFDVQASRRLTPLRQ